MMFAGIFYERDRLPGDDGVSMASMYIDKIMNKSGTFEMSMIFQPYVNSVQASIRGIGMVIKTCNRFRWANIHFEFYSL